MRREEVESLGLDIAVDRGAEIPIGVQLAWALRSRIRDGVFQPNERLPGLREVAEATGVNVNTVRTVYQRLEHEGLIDSQQGSGTFVATNPQRSSAVTTIAADAAREARETGVDPRDVAAALYISPASAAAPADDAAARRRALRDQVAALERTLVELEAKHPGVAPPAPHGGGETGGPSLLDVDALEHVRTLLVRRLSAVQAAIDGIGAEDATDRADVQARAERAPARKRAARARPALRPAPEGA
jgi:DNA-binding transcriptional regulator YhcF (GntR family)